MDDLTPTWRDTGSGPGFTGPQSAQKLIDATDQALHRQREILTMIAADAEADVLRYEGAPFDGKTLAAYQGEQNAMKIGRASCRERV